MSVRNVIDKGAREGAEEEAEVAQGECGRCCKPAEMAMTPLGKWRRI